MMVFMVFLYKNAKQVHLCYSPCHIDLSMVDQAQIHSDKPSNPLVLRKSLTVNAGTGELEVVDVGVLLDWLNTSSSFRMFPTGDVANSAIDARSA